MPKGIKGSLATPSSPSSSKSKSKPKSTSTNKKDKQKQQELEDQQIELIKQGKERHVSCEGCRRRKMRCNRQSPCSSCLMRSEDCIWIGKNSPLIKQSASSSTSSTFPSNTETGIEITKSKLIIKKLNFIIDNLLLRLNDIESGRSSASSNANGTSKEVEEQEFEITLENILEDKNFEFDHERIDSSIFKLMQAVGNSGASSIASGSGSASASNNSGSRNSSRKGRSSSLYSNQSMNPNQNIQSNPIQTTLQSLHDVNLIHSNSLSTSQYHPIINSIDSNQFKFNLNPTVPSSSTSNSFSIYNPQQSTSTSIPSFPSNSLSSSVAGDRKFSITYPSHSSLLNSQTQLESNNSNGLDQKEYEDRYDEALRMSMNIR